MPGVERRAYHVRVRTRRDKPLAWASTKEREIQGLNLTRVCYGRVQVQRIQPLAATRMRLLGYQIYRRSTDIQALARLSRKLVHCVRSGGSVLASPPCAIVGYAAARSGWFSILHRGTCVVLARGGGGQSGGRGKCIVLQAHAQIDRPPPRVSVPSW